MGNSNIKQIIAAPGWQAVFLLPDDPWISIETVAVWVLTEDGDIYGLVGGDSELSKPTDGLFLQYIHDSDIDPSRREAWINMARENPPEV
jgi:hypothetical protein